MHPEALRREDAAFQSRILCRLDPRFIDACLAARTDHGELDTRVSQVEQYKFQEFPDFGGPDAVLVKGDLTVAGNVEFQLVRLELRMLSYPFGYRFCKAGQTPFRQVRRNRKTDIFVSRSLPGGNLSRRVHVHGQCQSNVRPFSIGPGTVAIIALGVFHEDRLNVIDPTILFLHAGIVDRVFVVPIHIQFNFDYSFCLTAKVFTSSAKKWHQYKDGLSVKPI